MPWEIKKDGEKFCVMKKGSGSVEKCHDTREDAEAHMAALYASEEKKSAQGSVPTAQKRFQSYEQPEVSYVPISTTEGQACAGCRWFSRWNDFGIPSCHLVTSWPEPIEPTGHCAKFEKAPDPEPYVQRVVMVNDDVKAMIATAVGEQLEEARKGIRGAITDALKSLFGGQRLIDGSTSGFKAFKGADGVQRWVGWYSNAFKDRDNEFFPARAIDSYVMRVDTGIVPPPELWLLHVPGSKAGKTEWVDRIGLISVAVGTFDDTPAGHAAAKFFADSDGRWTMSHGFFFDVRQKTDDGAFNEFNTFEVSPLPEGWESNPYTQFEAVEDNMPMTEAKRAKLVEILGDELANTIITATEAKSKALQDAGVAYKDMPEMDAKASTDQAPAEGSGEKAAPVAEVVATVLSDNTELTAALVTALKEAQASSKASQQQVADLTARIKALEEQIALRPSAASESPETVIDEKTLPAHVKDSMKEVDQFWGVTVTPS